jgi:precorrin-6B C5,15-methyltransferase / cobalt-precorrin-6B C5,C15-methyltransferase
VAPERLRPDGRLVVNVITLENSGEVYGTLRKRGIVPEFTLLQISSAEPLARYLRFEALNPIQIFAAGKPAARGNSE